MRPPPARSLLIALLLGGAGAAGAADDPLDKPLLGHGSFTFLGSFRFPLSANGWSTAYSSGGLALRYVDGHLHFFSTSHVYSGGLVYEVDYPGISTSDPPIANLAHEWGDVYGGHKWVGNDGGSSTLGSGVTTDGLFWDEASHRLYWSYGHWYNTSNPFNPSIGYSQIDDVAGTATGIGAWSLVGRTDKFSRGGALRIPQWFADRFTGGNTLGVGFGGYYSIIGSGSLGPSLAAIADPDIAIAPDRSALPNVPLVGYQPAGGPGFAQRPGDYINRQPPGPFTGSITGATATSITVDYILRATGTLADSTIAITGGPGAGQVRDLTSWDYQSQTATVSPDWTTLPVAGASTYRIYGGFARGGSPTTIAFKATTVSHDYTGMYVIITDGTGAGQPERAITAWDQATQVATVTPAWDTVPDATSRYEYYSSGLGASVPDPQNGVGTWTWKDTAGGGTWIDLPDAQGVLVMAKIGSGHVWYEASDIHCEGGAFEWFLYDPKDLAAVASGAKAQSQIQPAAYWSDADLPLPEPDRQGWTGLGISSMGGAAFDPTTNRLYVLVEGAWQDGTEWHPQVYVYQVSGAISPGTAGSGSATGGSAGSGSGGSGSAGGSGAGGDGGHAASRCGLGSLGLAIGLGLVTVIRRRAAPRRNP
jgi:hypothetical protein